MILPVHFIKSRTFQYAILGSCVWHFFWLFVIHVDFKPKTLASNKSVRIHFLGQVLSDDSFNLVIDAKPELSQTLYQPDEELIQELEPDIEPLGRQETGDLVSVPMGRETWSRLRGSIQSGKEKPGRVFYERFPIRLIESPFLIQGELSGRSLFYLPPKPDMGLTAILEHDVPAVAEYEIEADYTGKVVSVVNVVSTGQPETDLIWTKYLSQWQFMPLESEFSRNQKGRVLLKSEAGNP